MSRETTFSIAADTGSPADTLSAIGAAFLIQHVADVAPEHVRISSQGTGFCIHVDGADSPRQGLVPLIPYFVAESTEPRPSPQRGELYDYASDKLRAEERKALDKVRPRKTRRRSTAGSPPLSEAEEDRATPSRRWPLYSALQALTKGAFQGEWNDTWNQLDGLGDADADRLAGVSWSYLRGVAEIPSLGSADAITLAQHLNPTAAKGANRAKPDMVKRDNMSGHRFIEWLKMVGLDRIGILRRVDTDVRLWVPIPSDVRLDALIAAHARFHETPWRQGNVKQDVLTAVDFSSALCTHWLAQKTPPRRRANRAVRGIAVASFKDMGGGFNVMNVTSYGLPGWIVLETNADLETHLTALDSFRSAARCLDESHSDEISVLASLREAVGAEDFAPLLAFLASYAAFLQRELARTAPRYVSRFTMDVLDAVLGGVSSMLSEIISDEGFRNIATAIRKATVSEQFHKSKGRQVYEIHYGLFADLRRVARRAPDFVSRLAEFISRYNAENARIAETKREQGRLRARVRDADLDAIVRLTETHGSEVVAHLLCAYGSATENRDIMPAEQQGGYQED